MTKKHFIALAETLAEIRRRLYNNPPDGRVDIDVRSAAAIVEDELSRFCRSQNGRFKQDVFIGYSKGECGPCGGTIRK